MQRIKLWISVLCMLMAVLALVFAAFRIMPEMDHLSPEWLAVLCLVLSIVCGPSGRRS